MSLLNLLFHNQGKGRPIGGGDDVWWLLRDLFTTARSAGAVDGTDAEPGPGDRTVTDTESTTKILAGHLRGLSQPTSAVWGESKIVWPSLARVTGRALAALIIPEDQEADLAFGWASAADIGDPSADGHGWFVGTGLDAITPGLKVVLNSVASGTRLIRRMQYLAIAALNDVGAYVLLSTFGTDTGDSMDDVGIPQYPLARIIWIDHAGTTDPMFPYASGYDVASGGYLHGHTVDDMRVVDVPTWTTADYLASFADRVTRANSTTSAGPLWTNRVGVFGVSSNKIYQTGAGNEFTFATADAGIADGIFEFDLTVNSDWDGTNAFFGFVLRFVDNNNFLRFWNNGGQNFYLQTFVGGAFEATIVAGPLPGGNLVAGQTYHFTVMTIGAKYKIWVDGAEWTTSWITDANNRFTTATNFGVYSHSAFTAKDTRWDNFYAHAHTVTLPTLLTKGAVPSVWTAGATLGSDTFTDANGTRLNAHTAEAGGAWTEVSGTWTVQSNKASVAHAAGDNIALQDVGVADVECSVAITNANPLGNVIFTGMVVRYIDASNNIIIREADDLIAQPDDHEIEVWVNTTADGPQLYGKTQMKVAYTAGGTRTLKAHVKGNLLEVFLDGAPRYTTVLPSSLASGTKFGLYEHDDDGGAVFDNWTVKAL